MNKKTAAANATLLFTALIWGMGFVAQRAGMEYVGPFTFTAARFLMAAALLLPIALFSNKKEKARAEAEGRILLPEEASARRKAFWISGFACSFILFAASSLQQLGLVFTTAGKAAFITTMYIFLVPVFGLFLKQRPGLTVWIGVAFGVVGLYFLSITESFTIATGDLIVLIGAVFWSFHVLTIDHFLPLIDPFKLACFQFAGCGVLGAVVALIIEDISWAALLTCAVPILYAGVMSSAVGFTLQILGQRHTNPTVASLLLSMEAAFGALGGFLLLQEIMTSRELLGCGLMFAAIIVAQLPSKKKAVPDQTA